MLSQIPRQNGTRRLPGPVHGGHQQYNHAGLGAEPLLAGRGVGVYRVRGGANGAAKDVGVLLEAADCGCVYGGKHLGFDLDQPLFDSTVGCHGVDVRGEGDGLVLGGVHVGDV